MYFQSVILESQNPNYSLDELALEVKVKDFDTNNSLIISRPETKKSIGISDVANILEWSSKKTEKLKICAILNGELLTTEAQNSLLKVLEDTPNNTLVVIVTSDVARLLNTVKSRCKIYKDPKLIEKNLTKKDIEDLLNDNFLNREKYFYELIKNSSNKDIANFIEELISYFLNKKTVNKNMVEFLCNLQIANYSDANSKLLMDSINFKLSK